MRLLFDNCLLLLNLLKKDRPFAVTPFPLRVIFAVHYNSVNMKKSTQRLLLACLPAFFFCTTHAQIKWDFDQGTGTASPVAASVPANLTASDFTFGNTFGTVTPMVTNTSASPTTANANYAIAGSGNYNATCSAVAGVFSAATSTYFTVTLTPASGYAIKLDAIQFGTRSIGAGPNAYQIYTSIDGYTTALVGNSLNSNSTWYFRQPTITSTQGLDATPVTIKVYGYSGVNPVSGTANWRIDDLYITATAVLTTTPVTLSSFSAALNNKHASLKWQTSFENNAGVFTIEKSTNKRDFSAIGNINASNKPQGSTYMFTDNEPISATVYYRMKMSDRDGRSQYSHVVSVTDKAIASLSIYPNPAINNITVTHPLATKKTIIRIINLSGITCASWDVAENTMQSNINIQQLQRGKYFLVLENEGNKSTIQFDKQ